MAIRRKKTIPFTLNSTKIYKPSQIKEVLELALNEKMLMGTKKGIKYYNVPCSFDIETTSFYVDENGKQLDYKQKMERKKFFEDFNPEKRATMYIWQLGINGLIIIGRTWGEFVQVIEDIGYYLELQEKKRLIIYVHNFAYEFQFICKLLKWHVKDEKPSIFSIEERKPIYAVTENFIEFRCSLLLSGYSLENLGKNLLKYKVEKLKGDLDYSLLRNCKTELTEKELQYCINDVKIVMAYIQEEIENNRGINNLPLTKTGKVRKYCRERCFKIPETKKGNLKFKSIIQELSIESMEEFKSLHRAFAGGFTHANGYYSRELLEKVTSFDFTSSYPYVMVSEMFPMGRPQKITLESNEEFEKFVNSYDKYLSVFDICIENLLLQESQETPLSVSKCFYKEDVIENNGRVVGAKKIITTITNVDFEILKKFYTWDNISIFNLYVYEKGYLPTELIKCILELYENKTILKGVEGQEVNYMQSKEMINSVYGMSVTNPLRDEYLFLDEWFTKENTPEEALELLYKYNISKNRFLYYPWGIFVTAYARRNLFTGIYEFKQDYVYSDTDSIKVLNFENHKEYFESYNLEVMNKLKEACKFHKIDFNRTQPKTKEGKIKPLGVWDFEGTYDFFKTLGAKRYMYSLNGKLSITIAGVGKKAGAKYLDLISNGDTKKAFDLFNEGLVFPPEHTGKNIHTYIDYEQTGILEDFRGVKCEYRELSSTHLEPTAYDLSLSKSYIDYLDNIQTEVI